MTPGAPLLLERVAEYLCDDTCRNTRTYLRRKN